ncbi:RAS guanyl-releasing protein 4 isoform X2 [Oncorhynchus tshawytscha]|uniref:RAS guanyl releasing protein 4 n=1 Tax=Oncorhynchus tshawytscha TaxID=74940 RepID=A0AAZ3PHY0_ONCTS|nr:RAS guanyl-releasing protein 4 isoform X2 [Oncorhynchus tshawytscha]
MSRDEERRITMNKAKRKSRVDSPGGVRSRRTVQRRMTCPSFPEITRVLHNPVPSPLTRSANLDELILRCLHCFDSDGKLSRGSQLVHMTLMMHSWVVPSQTFAQKLLALYKDCPVEKRGLRRPQVCHLISYDAIPPCLFEYASCHRGKCSCTFETFSQLSPVIPVSQAPSQSVKKRKVSLLFDHMEPDEMAEHLSYLEFKNFCNVSFLDYRSYVVRGSVRDNPSLERSVMMCNGVSQWVQLMILSRHTAQQRAQVFTKFLHVAQRLHALQNFNTLMAVTGGLCHSSISRLKDTASLLPPDVTKALSEMTELLSSSNNYSNYRRVYSECSGFKVPILGVHLKDLISLNEALPDYLEEQKINLGKLQHLYSNISDLLSVHSCSPPFEANKDLLHLLTLSLDLYYTEDEIYELSYTKEPKNPKTQPVAPVKSPVVAEWGSGVTPRLDPDTISKHVKQMVDSIMKNYDLNQDGYISLEDFKKIAANFPFSFCNNDSDREGEISHQQINSYFMRGMSVCAKLGYNFKNVHNFHETTYKRPTFCDTCGGFLWGVIKQGFHCRDCGVNCHRHCQDLCGMQCVKRDRVYAGSCPSTPASALTPVPDLLTKANSWSSSEDNTFVFPGGNSNWGNNRNRRDLDRSPLGNRGDSALSDRSTQTDPGLWMPVSVDKKGNQQVLPIERDRGCVVKPQRFLGSSMPASFLQEKMEELNLIRDKSREPD